MPRTSADTPDTDAPMYAREAPLRGARFLDILGRLTTHNPALAAGIRGAYPNAEQLARAAQDRPTVLLDSADLAHLEAAHDRLIYTVTTAVHPAAMAAVLGMRPAHEVTRGGIGARGPHIRLATKAA